MVNKFIMKRQDEVLSFISSQKYTTVNDICKKLNLSPSTVRRDIKVLEEQRKITLFHGGVAINENYGTFTERRTHNVEEKRVIGEYAAKLVTNGDVIYIGGGSTTYEFALSLASRVDFKRITVITCAFNIASCFINNENIRTIIAGGELIAMDESMTSKLTIDAVKQFNFTKAFIGCRAVNAQQGLMCPRLDLNELKKVVVSNTKDVILMCDHTKIGRISALNTCPLSDLRILITDKKAKNNSALSELIDRGLEVVLV